MYHTKSGSYDEIPEGMKRYINNYGCHFNKKLWEEATSRMYRITDGRREYITPYTKEQIENMLKTYGIEVKRGKLYDAAYVASMAKADYLGSSIVDEVHLALFVKDMLDDPDAEDGYVFNAFYAKSVFNNDPIDWDECI